ncbi:MAG: 4-alpha-glucanotransferase [Chitinophagaceae bacterium]|nr:4-alpha-glucanotransferase [Chitinophagaceae bacterium]
MKVHFFVRFHTKQGQTLLMSGNTPTLGDDTTEAAIPMNYFNEEFWQYTWVLPVDAAGLPDVLQYHYILKNPGGEIVHEWGDDRAIELTGITSEETQIIDTWNHAGEYENVFSLAPFMDVLLEEKKTAAKKKAAKNFTHSFKVKSPLLMENEVICLIGGSKALSSWNSSDALLMVKQGNWWTVNVNLTKDQFPIAYKYGVYNTKYKQFVQYEGGNNRILHDSNGTKKITILHDGFAHLPNNFWRAAGINIPVFSLRSQKSFGVGEFTDLKLLIDWAGSIGLKMIQILPVNDTTSTHTWTDTYPYSAISAFALHPLYLNLEKVAGKKYAGLIKPLKKKQKQLNSLKDIDYEQVLKFKFRAIDELYHAQEKEVFEDEGYKDFFDKNKYWLVPYAAYSYLRDKNGTPDFSQWKQHSIYDEKAIEKLVSPSQKHFDEIGVHYFAQYHLHLQLKEAHDYAHKKGIIVKGDIPIGVNRFGVDTWMEPELYHLDVQAGAPPDDFAVKGQNWSFPTYNWKKMREDGYAWWKTRFEQMSRYFDAFRIDHILGFFRIWSIPVDSVEGIMGHFVPAIPVHINEFNERHIWFNWHRYCRPHITDTVLWEMFGPNSEKFKPFLVDHGDGTYSFKQEYSSQKQVEKHFEKLGHNEENERIKHGLYDLLSNVILIEDPDLNGGLHFHFRFGMEGTTSFRHLEWGTQQQLKELYVDYFFRRQDNFWMREAMQKLPALKRATKMLICGEDLGMVPHCVPDVMKQLGILSLEIQRMPKNTQKEFFHPNDAPYMSVVTPSTHDMSTIRGWWEEDRAKTQRFYNHELGQFGEAPYFCEAWISKAILIQHLYSPAMWSVFLLQDMLGIDEKLRRENPHEERINVPANPKNYWKYRMHITLEELIKEKGFNSELQSYIKASGRA